MVANQSDLLSLLYNAHDGVEALALTTNDMIARNPSNTLVIDRSGPGQGRPRWQGGGMRGDAVRTTRQVWYERPDRLRVEVVQGGEVVAAAARDGSAWWRWNVEQGDTTGEIQHEAGLPPILELPFLHPERLLSSMWLTAIGTGERLGRQVVTATALPRAVSEPGDYVYEFDREHATPLMIVRAVNGATTGVTEVTGIRYEPALDPDTFAFAKRDRARYRRATVRSPAHHAEERRASAANRPDADDRGRHQTTVWLTGLSGAGKTTIANAAAHLLWQQGTPSCVLDGDDLRQGLSSDLGLTREDRREQARRVAHVAAIVAAAGVVPIVALVSPYAEDRDLARDIHDVGGVGFLEIWVDTPLEVCAARDPKGLYAAHGAAGRPRLEVLKSDGSGLTGVSSPYEIPATPDLRISGAQVPAHVAAAQVVEMVTASTGASPILTGRGLPAGP